MLKKISLTLLLLMPALASAVPITITQSQNQTEEGERLRFDFLSLDPATTDYGFLRVASAPGSDFDLSNGRRENFRLLLDGESVGRYNCSGRRAIQMSSCNDDSSNNTFDLLLSFSDIWNDFGVDVADLIADGMLRVTVNFGRDVDPGFTGLHPNNPNQLDVTLGYNYESVSVPEPGTLLLLGAGLLGVAAMRRRRVSRPV